MGYYFLPQFFLVHSFQSVFLSLLIVKSYLLSLYNIFISLDFLSMYFYHIPAGFIVFFYRFQAFFIEPTIIFFGFGLRFEIFCGGIYVIFDIYPLI